MQFRFDGAAYREQGKHWNQVIRHLATEYGFPVANLDELSFLFGNTFRIEKERWKFVVDVIRGGHEILSIVAITLTAKSIEDERHNGAVIARACTIHPNDDEDEYVGHPLLKWYMVTSGGMSFQHCCDKECSGPDKMLGNPRLNWEGCRLRIIQKAYEQEALRLFRSSRNQSYELNLRNMNIVRKSNEIRKLGEEAQEAREEARQAKEEAQEAKEVARLAKNETQEARSDFEDLSQNFSDLQQQKHNIELELFENQKSLARILCDQEEHEAEQDALQMRILSLEKENHVKDATIRNLRTEIETARQIGGKTHGAGVNTEKLWKKLHRSERKKNSYSHKLRDMREESAAKIHTLEAAKADLQTQIHTTSKNHCKEKVALQNEVQHIRQQNDDISHGYKELLEQKAGLQIEIKNMDENKKQMDARFAQLETGTNVNNDYSRQLEAQLGSANRELQHVRRKHVDELDQLRREIQTKAVLIQQLQQDYRYHGSSNDQPVSHRQPGPLEHSSDSNAQRTALQEARERTSDLENKVKGLKKAMEDKTNELEALEKSWADKLSAVADREKKCADRESYIATLEKELEEVRGTLEDVIGRVSSHQSSKRRRTENSEDLV